MYSIDTLPPQGQASSCHAETSEDQEYWNQTNSDARVSFLHNLHLQEETLASCRCFQKGSQTSSSNLQMLFTLIPFFTGQTLKCDIHPRWASPLLHHHLHPLEDAPNPLHDEDVVWQDTPAHH